MARRLPAADTEPWFRQFWPWFLILLPASVVVASFVTLYIANRHADDLVVASYYKDGLAINRQLAQKQLAVDLGIAGEPQFTGNTVQLFISGPVAASSLVLQMSHPLESDRDFSVLLERIGAGHYRGRMPQSVAPRWHWIVKLPQHDGWRLDGVVADPGAGTATAPETGDDRSD
ncbi:MAG: FixH family protein [Halioglobus sp.]|nr:FixH family protein [Halioglobus sp.]